MQMGVITFKRAASFRNQAELIVKVARKQGYETLDLSLRDATVGPPKYRFDKFIAVIPLWPRYLFDVTRLVAWCSQKHIIYGPVDGPYPLNVGLFQVMKNMRMCSCSEWGARMVRKSAEIPCMVNYHGINHEDFTFSQERIDGLRKQWLGTKKNRTILFANLTPIGRKGFPQLCQAIELLHKRIGNKFVFVLHTGLKPAKKMVPNIEKVPNLIIEDTYNTLPFRAIALKTVAADLYVNPSLNECFGLPILEAMAGKTAVVTSEAPAVSELIGDKEGWVFPIYKVKEERWSNGFLAQLHMYHVTALADAMQTAIEHPAESKEKVQIAYDKSLRYDYNKVYSDLIKKCGT